MSFYCVIKTEIKNKRHLVAALEEMRKRGELTKHEEKKKQTIEVDRDGEKIDIKPDKEGNYQVAGDARLVRNFSNRLKQMYALETIKENMPLDFELAQEVEQGGEIKILLKG